MSAVLHYEAALPWSPSPEDDRRLRRIMAAMLAAMALFFFIVPLVDIPDRLIDRAQEVPARFAQMILQDRPTLPPPPPVLREEAQPQPETKSEPEPKKEAVAKEKPAVTEPVSKPEQRLAVAQDTQTPAAARERAARTGLLALSQELAGLRSTSAADDMERKQIQQRSTTATAATSHSDAAIITARRGAGSGGIDTSGLAHGTTDTQLATRETTRIEAPASAGGTAGGTGAAHGGRASSGTATQRSSEEIQMIFDQNKGALNALYNRALRSNPGLSGKIVLRLTIEPGGQVSACELVSSQLGDPELERRLLARVQMFDFGAKQVATTTITYPIDFFPG